MSLWSQFVNLVHQHFGYLRAQFGYELMNVNEPFVRFRRDDVEVELYYDVARRHELDLALRRFSTEVAGAPSLHLPVIAVASGCPIAHEDGSEFAFSAEELDFAVQRLAADLKRCGSDLLSRDADAWHRAETAARST